MRLQRAVSEPTRDVLASSPDQIVVYAVYPTPMPPSTRRVCCTYSNGGPLRSRDETTDSFRYNGEVDPHLGDARSAVLMSCAVTMSATGSTSELLGAFYQ
jgi:hypothetical protein